MKHYNALLLLSLCLSSVEVASKVAAKSPGFDGFGAPNEFNRDDEDEVDAGQPNMPPPDDTSDDDANMVTQQDVDSDDDSFVQLGRTVAKKSVRPKNGEPLFDENPEEEELSEEMDEDDQGATPQADSNSGPVEDDSDSEFDTEFPAEGVQFEEEEADKPATTSEEHEQADLGSDIDNMDGEEDDFDEELKDNREESNSKQIAHHTADHGAYYDGGDFEEEEEPVQKVPVQKQERKEDPYAVPAPEQVAAEINRLRVEDPDSPLFDGFIQIASKKAERFLSK